MAVEGHVATPRRIIGIDCAVDRARMGIAVGWLEGPHVRVDVALCPGKRPAADVVNELLAASGPVLLALDAPLGWPPPLSDALSGHQAGGSLPPLADPLFRRCTDRAVHHRYGKMPLDVGADRIARTAHAALCLLQALHETTHDDIPLAWRPASVTGTTAIEVYPAATLRALGLPSSGYKRPEQRRVREEILAGLRLHLDLPETLTGALVDDADILDAAVCVLAGADFLRGLAVPPTSLASCVVKEGWIWVREGFQPPAADSP